MTAIKVPRSKGKAKIYACVNVFISEFICYPEISWKVREKHLSRGSLCSGEVFVQGNLRGKFFVKEIQGWSFKTQHACILHFYTSGKVSEIQRYPITKFSMNHALFPQFLNSIPKSNSV